MSTLDSLIPSVGALMMGGVFVIAGAKRIVDPIPTSAVIKRTKFYEGAVRYGIPLNKGNNLNNFTVVIGGSLVVAGLLFTLNIRRRLASGYLSALLAAFTAFVYVNLDAPMATTETNKQQVAQNFALMGGLLMTGFGRRSVTTTWTEGVDGATKTVTVVEQNQ